MDQKYNMPFDGTVILENDSFYVLKKMDGKRIDPFVGWTGIRSKSRGTGGSIVRSPGWKAFLWLHYVYPEVLL